ncbi:MAG TPA: homoserine O-succinyltransferase [Steroidobacteraceae bacterium]|nr:homoserine O-succinyltransferase [Steroidobacteraceae bacterium]
MARDLTDNPFDVSTVVDGVLDLPPSWRLHYGDPLPHPRVAFRLEGPAHAPVVAVLGGISAHRHLIAPHGWWPTTVGPNLGVDSTRFRVLGLDYLGGLGGSSTPDGEAGFPPVSANDQADVLRHVVLHLGLDSLHAIVGASYGGMVALCFAARHPALSRRIVVVSAADRPQILSTAWRSVQRQIVREAIARGDGPSGLKLARALAMATYRSQAEFAMRFSGAPVRNAERFRFPVEGYLFARGDDYVQKYRAESFLALSESIDLHEVDAAQVRTPATLIAVREDQLVPFGDMQALAARLGGPARLVEINSIFGHDAFLKESAVLNPILQKALAEQST